MVSTMLTMIGLNRALKHSSGDSIMFDKPEPESNTSWRKELVRTMSSTAQPWMPQRAK